MKQQTNSTLGVIVGNRSFFPDSLMIEARADITKLFEEMHIKPIWVNEEDTTLGSVETYEHAKLCANLFKKHADEIEGILVVLPNFGEEKCIVDTIKLSGLRVPVLVQAYPDDLDKFNIELRRDSFCGKISVCANLRQYGFPYSVTELHTSHLMSESFRRDLQKFTRLCKVVNGLRGARFGAIGARPGNFNTVRYSEKIMQLEGMSVTTIDMSEVLGWARNMKDSDPGVKDKLDAIRSYADATHVPADSLMRMAKLGVVIDNWVKDNDFNATAIECWSSLQENYGVNACTLMSMMGQNLFPSACEVDVTGAASMYALQLASGQPSALVDWNNNYGEDPDKCVLFHCGNWPKSFLPGVEIKYADILGTTLGNENTYGALAGRTPSGPMTFARITTDDSNGIIRTYVGEGVFTDDPLNTFGSRAVVKVPNLQQMLNYIVMNGFEHHVAMNAALSGDVIAEAFENYFGWDVYHHS